MPRAEAAAPLLGALGDSVPPVAPHAIPTAELSSLEQLKRLHDEGLLSDAVWEESQRATLQLGHPPVHATAVQSSSNELSRVLPRASPTLRMHCRVQGGPGGIRGGASGSRGGVARPRSGNALQPLETLEAPLEL